MLDLNMIPIRGDFTIPNKQDTRWAGPYNRYKWRGEGPKINGFQWGFFFTLLIGAPCPSTTGDFGPTEHNNV